VCILCEKSPSGQTRRIFPLDDSSSNFSRTVHKLWDIDISHKRDGASRNARYCLSCIGVLERAEEYKKTITSFLCESNDVDISAETHQQLDKRSKVNENTDHVYALQCPIKQSSNQYIRQIYEKRMSADDLSLLVRDITELMDRLCSKTIMPGPSVLRTRNNPADLKKVDLISEIILEMEK